MNAEVFSDAMDVIDIKYVEEAMCYRRKKISVPWIKIGAVAAACILLVGTFTIYNFSKQNQQGVFEIEPTRTLPSEKVEDTKNSIGSETNQGFSTGECAADMHRPAGYHPRIGSALALKLSLHKESPEMVYDVVIPCFHRFGEDDCIVERLSDRLNTTSWRRWARIQWPDRGIEEKYHAQLTLDQINVVVEAGLSCFYIGSGEGNLADMSFDNPKGIETYCELVGDMYTFASDGSIVHKPDLLVEGLVELEP